MTSESSSEKEQLATPNAPDPKAVEIETAVDSASSIESAPPEAPAEKVNDILLPEQEVVEAAEVKHRPARVAQSHESEVFPLRRYVERAPYLHRQLNICRRHY